MIVTNKTKNQKQNYLDAGLKVEWLNNLLYIYDYRTLCKEQLKRMYWHRKISTLLSENSKLQKNDLWFDLIFTLKCKQTHTPYVYMFVDIHLHI